jgi:conjugative relaxase-like TrwC/TraI family protein
VLRIHVVRQGGHHYYVDDLVPGRAEGGRVAGEEPGRWSGDGAAGLGLDGAIDPHHFAEVLGGRHPASGSALRSARADRGVAGYDLTFGAPKSVSLLHLLAPREIATEVGAGHQAAVREAVGYLGRSAVGVRRVRQGEVSLLPSTGAVAGNFLHRTSRALDPHLHTHLVVANVAQGVDGGWSAVDSRRLFAHGRAAQGIYHARLRLELGDRLGAAWDVKPSGLGDVVGVDPTMRRLFSQRSASMAEYESQRPGLRRSSGRFSDAAFHATRPEKDRTCTVESLKAEWRQRAGDFGFDLGDLTRVVGQRQQSRMEPGLDAEGLRSRLVGLAHDHRSMARRDVVAEVASSTTGGASARTIESYADYLVVTAGEPRSVSRAGGDGRDDLLPRTAATELRWDAADVTRALERQRDRLVLVPDRTDQQLPALGRSDLSTGREIDPAVGPGSRWLAAREAGTGHQLER